MKPETFPFLINLHRGSIDEPAVNDETFLESFLRAGVWLRVLAADQHYRLLTNPKSGSVARYAAAVAIYQLAGMVYEDAVASLVSWTVKNKWQNLSFANIISRINLVRRAKPIVTDSCGSYHLDTLNEFVRTASKPVRINPLLFLQSLAALDPKSLLVTLGVRWKQVPSVKLVPKQFTKEWETLPKIATSLVAVLADENKSLMTNSYNKLKHGPQLLVTSLRNSAVARGHSESALNNFPPDREFVRLLLAGERTQEEDGEIESGQRVAPFIIDDAERASGIFYDFIVATPQMMELLGRWVFRCIVGRMPCRVNDNAVFQIQARAAKRLNIDFPVRSQ